MKKKYVFKTHFSTLTYKYFTTNRKISIVVKILILTNTIFCNTNKNLSEEILFTSYCDALHCGV